MAGRILIVDDNVDAAEMLAELLRLESHEVDIAHDGPQALEVAAKVSPAVALVDIGLPGMDGYELARALRGRYGTAVRLVALTGYGQPSDIDRTRQAGFDAHLVKPVSLEAIQAALHA